MIELRSARTGSCKLSYRTISSRVLLFVFYKEIYKMEFKSYFPVHDSLAQNKKQHNS